MILHYLNPEPSTLQEKSIELAETVADTVSYNIKRFIRQSEYFKMADEICVDWGKYGFPGSEDTEEKVASWTMETYGSMVIIKLGLGKTDTFKEAIKFIASLPQLKEFKMGSHGVNDSFVERFYTKKESKEHETIAFFIYPSQVANAECKRVQIHNLGPEYKLVCEDTDILAGEDLEDGKIMEDWDLTNLPDKPEEKKHVGVILKEESGVKLVRKDIPEKPKENVPF